MTCGQIRENTVNAAITPNTLRVPRRKSTEQHLQRGARQRETIEEKDERGEAPHNESRLRRDKQSMSERASAHRIRDRIRDLSP